MPPDRLPSPSVRKKVVRLPEPSDDPRAAVYHGRMPSWNVHTAHVERLLAEATPAELGIRDINAFLFGNFVPDIYVGYMVEHTTGILPYRVTHFADPGHIPIPREREFWDTYVVPTRQPPRDVPVGPAQISVDEGVEISRAGGHFAHAATAEQHARLLARLADPSYRASDLTLGAWAHLLCDNVYNTATHAWLHEHHVAPGEQTRIRKQDDFLRFGRTLAISRTCQVDGGLLRQAATFPQYSLVEHDVRAAVRAAADIVTDNRKHHITRTPDYDLLSADFFHDVFEEANRRMLERLRGYAVFRA